MLRALTVQKKKYKPTHIETFRMCLDGEKISARIAPFELVIENNVRLVIFREM
jgi:hypothetical protein